MTEQVKKVMGSRMFILGMTAYALLAYGMTLVYLISTGTPPGDPSAMQATVANVALVAGVVTGGASAVNVFKERNSGP